jgi:chloride channel 7
VVLSVASGLIVGKEGPFTHVGAILGGGVAHLGSTTLTRATKGQLRAKLHTRFGRYFKSSVSHRDYVAAGASAGEGGRG